MNPYLHLPKKTPSKFQIGDQVFVKHAWGGITGEVIYDLGNIGYQGQRLYTVRFPIEGDPEVSFAEDEMEPAKD